jgi:hypothetical protein
MQIPESYFGDCSGLVMVNKTTTWLFFRHFIVITKRYSVVLFIPKVIGVALDGWG